MRIFLSHSHQDNDWCSAFVEELTRCGADVWYDKQGLYVGAKWLQTIETELEGRDTYLVVLTPAAWSSSWVRDELALALAQHKRIVSVVHQPTQVSGFITNYQMLDVIGLRSAEAAQAVAKALGLMPAKLPDAPTKTSEEKPAAQPNPVIQWGPSGVSKLADRQYGHFEITDYSKLPGKVGGYQITNRDSNKVFYRPLIIYAGSHFNPDEASAANQKAIEALRAYAKVNGLEELPEKGEKWYSYRFRRKMQ